MAMLPRRVEGLPVQPAALGFVLTALLVAVVGCQSGTYRATRLPAELMAPPPVNIEEVDLSQLSTFSVSSERIDRGDVLEVTVVTDSGSVKNSTTPVRVDRDGSGNVPLIGPVALAGLELDEAEQRIAAEGIARGVFQRPHVTVTMKRQRTNRITVIGAVAEPGVYEIPRTQCSLLAALVEAGGLSEDAGREVELRRPTARSPGSSNVILAAHETPVSAGPQITMVNLATAASEGNGGHYLEDGDVVNVRKRSPKPVYVIGLVNAPGEYEMPQSQDMRVLDALAKAGDRKMGVADKVFVIRRVPDRKEPIVIQTSIRQAKRNDLANVQLAPGDIVSVEDTPVTVTLDTLKSFIRFGMSSAVPIF